MEELAQSVGNEKMPGEFDWDAATVVDPNTNDGGSFQHLVDSNPALGREEVLSLLSQKIAQLTPGPKKVLAIALSRASRIVRDSSLHRRD
jgi:hypothetical protein